MFFPKRPHLFFGNEFSFSCLFSSSRNRRTLFVGQDIGTTSAGVDPARNFNELLLHLRRPFFSSFDDFLDAFNHKTYIIPYCRETNPFVLFKSCFAPLRSLLLTIRFPYGRACFHQAVADLDFLEETLGFLIADIVALERPLGGGERRGWD